MTAAVRPTEALDGVRRTCPLRTGRLFAERTVGWEMPRARSVDIDTTENLVEAEGLVGAVKENDTHDYEIDAYPADR